MIWKLIVRKEVFLPYEHREWIAHCVPHPGNIVEPASLAVIESVPKDSSNVSQALSPAAVKEGKLSSLQLESIIKAVSSIWLVPAVYFLKV